jgi:hypothetical protein
MRINAKAQRRKGDRFIAADGTDFTDGDGGFHTINMPFLPIDEMPLASLQVYDFSPVIAIFRFISRFFGVFLSRKLFIYSVLCDYSEYK